MFWEKYSRQQINDQVFEAIGKNLNYRESPPIGLPASFLDPKVFYSDAPFLKNAPYMSTMVANPNHIGCHTLGDSEPVFKGTQALERELIEICATQIFRAEADTIDGYVASGGTEANIQAFWVMRNYFMQAHNAKPDEIGMVYSTDSHYSMPKGVNLLGIRSVVCEVDDETRLVASDELETKVEQAIGEGIKHFVVVMNMSTTMFGSVDDIQSAVNVLEGLGVSFKIHVDGAYGGFIYPFTSNDPLYSFENKHVHSISLDAHKMLQSPYGTGIALIRKGYIEYAMTEEANYVKGKDYTLVGSRSGANAVAIWMILRAYGSQGWKSKIEELLDRTNWLCGQLKDRGMQFYRHPNMNIITLRPEKLPADLAVKYFLVPDDHNAPSWWKIVVMDHVTEGVLDNFLFDLDNFQP